MLRARYPYFLANRAVFANEDLLVTDKFTGAVATRVARADAAAIEAAIAAAHAARPALAALPSYARRDVLAHCARRFRERADELAQVLCVEAGKPIRDARGEVLRLIDTFRLAAEEATRLHGEVLDLALSPRTAGARGFTRRVSIGACSFISPFNFPLNLAAHKIAPALACGCPFVLKPASRTPVSALLIGEVLAETDLPPGTFSILPTPREGAEAFVADERLALLSFTGSPAVGWALKARAGRKKVVLELGGNAACIVDADQGEHLDRVVERLVFGAYSQSGQSCISVQRILVHEAIYEPLREKLVAAVATLRAGDPRQEETIVGPLISEGEARRVEAWIEQALAAGARRLCGGRREGALLDAALLEDVPPGTALDGEEVFGPVAGLARFSDFDEALARVNASRFGLQAGVFTRDLGHALAAWERLEVGGVILNDVPTWRVDHMPYGGVKESGLGREGVRSAIEEMTEPRLLVIRE